MFVFDAVLAVSNDGERIARYFEGGQFVRVKRAAPKRAAVLNNGVLYFGVADGQFNERGVQQQTNFLEQFVEGQNKMFEEQKETNRMLQKQMNELQNCFKKQLEKVVIIDMELAIKRAVEEVLPNSQLSACFFHYTQALMRKWRSMAIERRCDSNNELTTANSTLRDLMALALIPVGLVRKAFCQCLSVALLLLLRLRLFRSCRRFRFGPQGTGSATAACTSKRAVCRVISSFFLLFCTVVTNPR
ncbi:hypothetical protein GPALN_010832 [Globodera pallida]|nr:hypothetical protein GPALN_010832 [Globodera pallida]